MKRLLQLTLVLLITAGLTTVANAQGLSDNASINANANVRAQLTVSGPDNLTFGNVLQGNTKTIDYFDDTNAGRFLVSGSAATNVTLTTNTPTELSDGTNTIGINSFNFRWNDGTSVTDGGGASVTSGGTVTIPSDGDFSVFVGATVDAAGTPPTGTYNGTITLTASYN